MTEELYDALKDAGAAEEKARAVARAIARFETEFETEMEDIRATQRLHSWMLGTLIALNIAILFRVF